MNEWMALGLFISICLALLLGYPVAFSLGGTALLFAALGHWMGNFDLAFLSALPNRIYGIMTNEVLIAVPLFVFMGVMLERARIAENLLQAMGVVFRIIPGGLGISVTLVGTLLAASTGIVGATVVTMGLIALPSMLKQGYDPRIATGVICASGTLGQIIPPSIVLVLLGDVLSSAYQQAQLAQGIFAPKTFSVGDLFMGAIIPGLVLVFGYITYLLLLAWHQPQRMPPHPVLSLVPSQRYRVILDLSQALIPPLLLILAVLGSIMRGIATPTEAASVGSIGSILLALSQKQLTLTRLQEVMRQTVQISSMVFMILIGASLFSLVFRGFNGDEAVHELLTGLPGGHWSALWAVMAFMFLLGFVIDFIEIIFIVVPIVGPVLLTLGFDPIWLGIMMGINLQTSFLTPPFGFSLFYLRSVTPQTIRTTQIYQGVIPFILIQLGLLLLLALWPALATWLPQQLYGQ